MGRYSGVGSRARKGSPVPRIARPRTAVLAAGLVGTAVAVAPALATTTAVSRAAVFTKRMTLKGYAGGEPSLALDPVHPSNVYVTAPQAIPSIANNALWSTGLFSGPTPAPKGVGFWASHDGGRTFPIAQNIGSAIGGGDSDVEVGSDGTVYVADLEAVPPSAPAPTTARPSPQATPRQRRTSATASRPTSRAR